MWRLVSCAAKYSQQECGIVIDFNHLLLLNLDHAMVYTFPNTVSSSCMIYVSYFIGVEDAGESITKVPSSNHNFIYMVHLTILHQNRGTCSRLLVSTLP